jgi:hypothetical protein
MPCAMPSPRPKPRGNGRIFTNLPALEYWSLLRYSNLMIGNGTASQTIVKVLSTVPLGQELLVKRARP